MLIEPFRMLLLFKDLKKCCNDFATRKSMFSTLLSYAESTLKLILSVCE